ncbi:MAG: PaaD-like protein (DUF59) involved in Fe-S cluster assembly, partial [uncultured Corynebacteriales bacterium]
DRGAGGPAERGRHRGGHARRRRSRAGDQRRRPRPGLRRPGGRRPQGDPGHDADLRGLPADRRHRGPDPGGAHRRPHRRRGLGLRDQLGLDAAVGPGQDHRRRPGAAARPRLQRL